MVVGTRSAALLIIQRRRSALARRRAAPRPRDRLRLTLTSCVAEERLIIRLRLGRRLRLY